MWVTGTYYRAHKISSLDIFWRSPPWSSISQKLSFSTVTLHPKQVIILLVINTQWISFFKWNISSTMNSRFPSSPWILLCNPNADCNHGHCLFMCRMWSGSTSTQFLNWMESKPIHYINLLYLNACIQYLTVCHRVASIVINYSYYFQVTDLFNFVFALGKLGTCIQQFRVPDVSNLISFQLRPPCLCKSYQRVISIFTPSPPPLVESGTQTFFLFFPHPYHMNSIDGRTSRHLGK